MSLELDSEGFLTRMELWTPEVATALADDQMLELSTAHMELLIAARDYYEQFGHSPLARSFVKFMQVQAPDTNSITLMRLFPPSASEGSSIRQICRISGLPKPAGCL